MLFLICFKSQIYKPNSKKMNQLTIRRMRLNTIFILLSLIGINLTGQITQVGSGSFTNTFPGVDAANRNTYPSGEPFISGVAATKSVPTNDWWSSKVKNNHVNNLFNYPLAFKTINAGLVVSYINTPSGGNGSSQPMDDISPIVVGVSDLNASSATVSDYSDFTVTMNWSSGAHSFNATAGIAMPFVYFTKNTGDIAKITVNEGTVTIDNEMLVIVDAHHGADFAVYAPVGSSWQQSGSTYTSSLNGEDYWSIAYIPPSATSVAIAASEYKKYAYVFPVNTTTSWSYNESTSVLRTTISVDTEIKEGTQSNVLLGLLPHQWSHLASDSPSPQGYSYASIRGEIKTLDGNEFYIENKFHGILPTLPYLNNYSEGFSLPELDQKIQLIENDGLSTWTDSYNEGQVMNRLIQTARIADLTGNTEARDKMLATIKDRLEDWLTAEAGEVAFLFYYNSTWTTLIGYPAGHGQDGNINDHHFHWGYFIHAAAFLQQFDPTWGDEWGEMINYLVRDAASPKRDDNMFPFLRNFSPYAGHCWANGFATFPFGNDQESTSESMQFNSSLIHWGTITGNDEIRDLGIYLYTTEQTAIEEYWFDIHERTFKPEYNYSLASRIWGNGYDNQTFWTSDIAAAYGIEMYPIHGGSLYLGHNLGYAQKLWTEISNNTGILSNQANANLWHDIMWEYLAFFDPQSAIDLYDSYPDRALKFGVSDAQTYYWLHSMNALGAVDTSITADYPIAAAFNKEGTITYTAHNYSNLPITVTFSDGYSLEVPAYKMATSRDISLTGTITTSYPQAFANGSVVLDVSVSGGTATKVEFFDGETLIGTMTSQPYSLKAANLVVGKHNFYAKIYSDVDFNVTNIAKVIVGCQRPYSGTAVSIPGIIEAGLFDKFEGGNGQGIAYNDVSVINEGGFRANEYVDASSEVAEGATVGWISSGEWLEYSINVQDAGLYSMSFRYASGNNNGGGPFYLELDGQTICDPINVNSTGSWSSWSSKTVNNIPFSSGEHIMRIVFESGEFNLGKMTFAYSGSLPYNQPIADAGNDIVVPINENKATLDGSNSSNPGLEPLSYKWTQVYGPSQLVFSDAFVSSPEISALERGVYLIELLVSNGSYSDIDELYVIVSDSASIAPTISINAPDNNSEFFVGTEISISAEASDLDGSIQQVEFFEGSNSIGTISSSPYNINWTSLDVGSYSITAIATDNDGNSTTSNAITINFIMGSSCEGTSHNEEFSYLFSGDDNNPTITFIPIIEGVGSPTCILYYGTNPGVTFPGYFVSPDVPFTVNASKGSTVYFYYSYSYPNEGEHNTADHLLSYVIGSCSSVKPSDSEIEKSLEVNNIQLFPNPVTTMVNIQLPDYESHINIYDVRGKLLDNIIVSSRLLEYNMSAYTQGIYLFEVKSKNKVRMLKVLKN